MKMNDKQDEQESSSELMSIMHGLKFTEQDDFEPIDVDIPVDFDDGEKVAVVLTGTVKDGKLVGITGTEFSIDEKATPSRIKSTLSEEDAEDDKEDE